MNRIILIALLFTGNILFAQKNVLDFVKNTTVDKAKTVAVKKERKDKYGYNSTIERSFMKAGYSVVKEFNSDYLCEYYIGTQPKKGEDDYTLRMDLVEVSTGKMVATASIITKRRNQILDNLQGYVDEFITKLNN